MLHNAYLLAKIGADTAENERHLPKFAKNWQLPYGRASLTFEPAPVGRAELGVPLAEAQAVIEHARQQGVVPLSYQY